MDMFKDNKKDKVVKRPKLKCGPSLTVRDPGELTNVNDIINRANRTGILIDPARVNSSRVPMFGDFSNGADFESAQHAIARAKSDFQSLPSSLREHYGNNPSKFLDALKDPKEKERLLEFGVIREIEPEPEPEPIRVSVVSQLADDTP